MSRAGFVLPRPYVLAHRGASGYAPENTLAAMERALAMGAHGAETDVRATRDGILVLMHDRTLDRTTDGSGPVGEATLAELRRLDAGSWFDPRFAGEPIATVAELLERYGGRLALTLEIVEDGIAEALVGLVRAHGLLVPAPARPVSADGVTVPPVVFTSSRPDRPLAARRAAPEATIGVNVFDFTDETIERAATAGFDQLCPPGALCTPERVAAARVRGLAVRATSIGDKDAMRTAIAAGVDGMTCNWPDWVLSAGT